MPLFLVTLSRSGPQWDVSRPLEQQSGWDEHAAYMDALVERRVVFLGGPLGDGRRVVLVCEASSAQDVLDALARDPWHESHLHLESVEAWAIRLDGRVLTEE